MVDRFFICTACGELTTWMEILEDLAQGGMGLCGCEYFQRVWNSETKEFDVIHFKHYRDYTEIPEEVYWGLKTEPNTAIRLNMLDTTGIFPDR
jgi:predicted  nucleic acid-binding Zn-ribbon protein